MPMRWLQFYVFCGEKGGDFKEKIHPSHAGMTGKGLVLGNSPPPPAVPHTASVAPRREPAADPTLQRFVLQVREPSERPPLRGREIRLHGGRQAGTCVEEAPGGGGGGGVGGARRGARYQARLLRSPS